MSKPCLTPVAPYRSIKAVTVVLALLLTVPGFEALVTVIGGRTLPVVTSEGLGLDSRQIVKSDDPYETLDLIEDAAFAKSAQVPEAFKREVGFLPDAEDIRADRSGAVVGYVVEGNAGNVVDCLIERMESLGWTAVSLGDVDGATFMKSGGACTWALATCEQVGDSTSVVVRCMYS